MQKSSPTERKLLHDRFLSYLGYAFPSVSCSLRSAALLFLYYFLLML